MIVAEGQRISRHRHQRITSEVAPMVARGASIDEIATSLGYGRAMAAKDVQECLRIWQVAHLEESEKWRPLILQRHEMLFREAFTAWEASKINGRPNAKFIDSASRSLETLSKLLGLQLDLTLQQNNITLGAANDTAIALAPLDVESYAEMLQAGSLGQLNNVPPVASKAP